MRQVVTLFNSADPDLKELALIKEEKKMINTDKTVNG